MGLYLRKSIKVGPVRFNFSKSGIGTSVGVKGFRVGIRSNGKSYVRMEKVMFVLEDMAYTIGKSLVEVDNPIVKVSLKTKIIEKLNLKISQIRSNMIRHHLRLLNPILEKNYWRS